MSVQKVKHEDVKKIRELNKKRMYHLEKSNELTIMNIAKMFDVSATTVWNICHGQSYRQTK